MTKQTKNIGKLLTVNISEIIPNTWNPKESIDDNSNNRKRYEDIVKSLKNKNFYEPILVREYQDKYQILDGYHRWLASQELGIENINVWNLGRIDDSLAKSITLDKIYLNVPAFELLTANIVKEISVLKQEDLELLPFSEMQIKDYLAMADFTWEDYKAKSQDSEEKKKQVTCPHCGEIFDL